MKVLLSVCLFFAPILAAPYAGTFLGDDTPSISGGDDFNVGPSEVAQEEHAKLEEAAQKALSIIEHAGKYMDDSIKEQSKRSVESYIARDIEKSADWEKRDKRQVSSADPDYPMPVPQTDSEAAKGHQNLQKAKKISKREITNFDDLIFEDINADAVRNKRESEDSESSEEKSSEESSEKEIEPETEAPGTDGETPEKPEVNSGPADWWKVESGLTPNKLDTLIDVVNKINDVFASFIERYDKFHGTSPKETTEEPEIMTPEAGMGGDDKTEAPEISKESVESKESTESAESSETDKEATEDSDDSEESQELTEDGDDEAEDDKDEDDKDEDEEVDEEVDEEKDEEDEEEDVEENKDDEAEDKDEDKDEDKEVDEEEDEDEDEDEDDEEEDDDEDDE